MTSFDNMNLEEWVSYKTWRDNIPCQNPTVDITREKTSIPGNDAKIELPSLIL